MNRFEHTSTKCWPSGTTTKCTVHWWAIVHNWHCTIDKMKLWVMGDIRDENFSKQMPNLYLQCCAFQFIENHSFHRTRQFFNKYWPPNEHADDELPFVFHFWTQFTQKSCNYCEMIEQFYRMIGHYQLLIKKANNFYRQTIHVKIVSTRLTEIMCKWPINPFANTLLCGEPKCFAMCSIIVTIPPTSIAFYS